MTWRNCVGAAGDVVDEDEVVFVAVDEAFWRSQGWVDVPFVVFKRTVNGIPGRDLRGTINHRHRQWLSARLKCRAGAEQLLQIGADLREQLTEWITFR